jgi:hypothetical protein
LHLDEGRRAGLIRASLTETQLGRHAWDALIGGNVTGLVLVGAYLVRRHPELAAQLRRDGDE